MIATVTPVQRFATKTLYTRARATDGSTMLAPMSPGAGKGLTDTRTQGPTCQATKLPTQTHTPPAAGHAPRAALLHDGPTRPRVRQKLPHSRSRLAATVSQSGTVVSIDLPIVTTHQRGWNMRCPKKMVHLETSKSPPTGTTEDSVSVVPPG